MTRQEIDSSIHYATLEFERFVPVAVSRVFGAYVSVEERMRWGAPSDGSVLLYDATNFSIGGTDRFRCGSKSNPQYHGTTWYNDIVTDSRIVSSERVEIDGRCLSVSLNTFEFLPENGGTRLRLTVQLASFVGSGMIKGNQDGQNSALDNLVRYLSPSTDV